MKKILSKLLILSLCGIGLASSLGTVLADNVQQTEPTPVLGTQYAYIPSQSIYFYDVGDRYPWGYAQADYLAAMGILKGTGSYLLEPEKQMVRADLLLMLYRAYGMEKYKSKGYLFEDTPANAYYADAVRAAHALDIAKGFEDRFEPMASISREDAMVFLARTIEKAGYTLVDGGIAQFTDAGEVSSYATQAIGKLAKAQVIRGDAQGKIQPKAPMTRMEMSVMLYRALMLERTEAGVVYTDYPERKNLCVGEKFYAGVWITNFDSQKSYEGLMQLLTFDLENNRYKVQLGEAKAIDAQITWKEGQLLVNGIETPLASSYQSVQVAPYSALLGQIYTGQKYRAGAVSQNEKGEAIVLYYEKK